MEEGENIDSEVAHKDDTEDRFVPLLGIDRIDLAISGAALWIANGTPGGNGVAVLKAVDWGPKQDTDTKMSMLVMAAGHAEVRIRTRLIVPKEVARPAGEEAGIHLEPQLGLGFSPLCLGACWAADCN